jgi:outer membrane receptor protein involved in Fe transport
MAYARLASGFRPGGPNTSLATGDGAPATFGPDKTKSYELGLKGNVLDHTLIIDLSAYYIQFQNIQISLSTIDLIGYLGNGPDAQSKGVDFASTYRPIKGLAIGVAGSFNRATFVGANAGAGINVGDVLPYTAHFSGDLNAEYEFPMFPGYRGVLGGDMSYVGQRLGSPTNNGPGTVFPAYAEANAHAGVKFDTWTINVYGRNLADRRGVLGNTFGAINELALITPRTIGFEARKIF